MKKTTLITLLTGGVAVAAMFAVFTLGNAQSKPPAISKSDIVSEKGIHWHPTLAIYIKGEKQTIPTGIGVGPKYASSKWYDSMMSMTDVHTHDDTADGKLHWEVMDNMTPVTKDHVRLGTFFEIWGRPFSATQILDSQNGPDGSVKMTVNGQPNTDYQNYLVHDGDKIEIRYE